MTEIDKAAFRLDEELLFLARQYPRDRWEAHENLGDLARLWLQRHDMFRKLDRLIREGNEEALAQRIDPAQFRPWLARYLQFFLGQLEGHHHVEDHHYFPIFRRAEPRLLRGFEILDSDHEALHTVIEEIAGKANALLSQPDPEAASFRSALERFRDTQAAMGRDLIRHLDDEEDLVVPLILDRGEGPLLCG